MLGGTAEDLFVDMTLRAHVHSRGYDHSALLYYSEREYVDLLVQFIEEGLLLGQPILLAVPGEKLATLCDALGGAAAEGTAPAEVKT